MDGAEVDRAADGREAVDMFASSPEGYYDIILMDIQMPVLDGREATVEIRRMNRNDSDEIPIFALSADAFVEDERYSLQVGMNGHFAKPIDFELLRKGIEKAMRKKNR
jgi:CheY-like chemotaxis protein